MDSAIRLTGITHADPRCKVTSAIGAGIVASILNGEYHGALTARAVDRLTSG